MMKTWISLGLCLLCLGLGPVFCGVSVDTLKKVRTTSIKELKANYPRLKPVSFMNFDNMLLSDVLNFFSQEFGLNVMTKDIPTTSISFYFEETHPLDAFQAILVSEGLSWYEREDFIYIYKGDPISLVPLNYVGQSDIQDTLTALVPDVELVFNETKNLVALKGNLDDVYRAKQLIFELDKMPQQVLIEVVILDIDVSESESLTFNTILKDAQSSSIKAGSSLFTGDNTGLKIDIVDQSITGFIETVRKTNNTQLVNAPKILAVNHKTASIFTGKREGYTMKTYSVDSSSGPVTENTTIVNEDIDYLETGTRLEVTPHITEEGDIVLDIAPEVSSGEIRNKLPYEATMEANTTVRVRDGQSVIIGGLITKKDIKDRRGIPFLMDIPFIQHFFSTYEDSYEKKEKIIILTPYLLTDSKQKELNKTIPTF